MIFPITGIRKRKSFAMNQQMRGMLIPSAGGSAQLRWFDARMAAPVAGMFS
jgi:hypothetical protein